MTKKDSQPKAQPQPPAWSQPKAKSPPKQSYQQINEEESNLESIVSLPE